MEIKISTTTTIEEIKSWFSAQFQQLKIEFFLDEDHDGRFSSEDMIMDNNVEIGSIRETGSDGVLKISRKTTVSALERLFQESFGVNVEVFRRSGNLWLLTIATDNLSLSEQNELAAASLKKPIHESQIDYIDLNELE
ncbi:hypothetical protein [Solitalea koreensis]|uniref:Uncharacterized protein n=1 Tax=Solitalea koreensis TaxID=543615 RepID=A0A521EA12_9SPHI|nr:hypothetical protein [Solitalea koreensis]SMO80000.1 hypothetical protein SAMN06265350_11249 [Solitalea koreensis]